MSDRICGFVVILEKDLREEGAEQLMKSIKLLKGVCDVQPKVSNFDVDFGYARGKLAFKEKLFKFMQDDYLEDNTEMKRYMK